MLATRRGVTGRAWETGRAWGMGPRGGGCIEVTLGRSHLASHSALGSGTMRGPSEPRSAGSGTTEMESLSRSIGTPFGSSQLRRTRFPSCVKF